MTEPILVGYDSAPAAVRALDRAIEEAKAQGAKLIVLAVVDLPPVGGPMDAGTLFETQALALPPVPPPAQQRVLDEARERVEAAGVEAEYVSAAGDPATAIIEVAQDRGASLVVLGHVHHSWLGRAFGADVAFTVQKLLGAQTLLVD
ncbi:MAG TPA: universal stress protein [Gaiellaceae bacterium]|jgi:nucleotide-binding universal stress UspA family protein